MPKSQKKIIKSRIPKTNLKDMKLDLFVEINKD